LEGAQFAADPNDARHVVTVDGDNFQLNEAVIQREQITWLDGARQTGESHRDVLLVACHRLRREREGVTGLQFNLFHPKITNPHFGTGQIRHDRYSQSHLSGHRPDVFDDLPVAGELAMREVEPSDVHSGANHFSDDLWRL